MIGGKNMGPHELLNRLEKILEDAKTAVLATTDKQGNPHMRWMTPALLRYRPREIFTFAVPDSAKIEHIAANDHVEWMIQSKDLSEIINVSGIASVIDNPSIKTELMEILGPKLTVFWKANADKNEFVVIETVIKHAEYLKPIKGLRQQINFP